MNIQQALGNSKGSIPGLRTPPGCTNWKSCHRGVLKPGKALRVGHGPPHASEYLPDTTGNAFQSCLGDPLRHGLHGYRGPTVCFPTVTFPQ